MIAGVLLVALAQEPRRSDDLPLRNDATLGLSKELGDEFARGDALPALSAQAFDAWQRALRLGAQDLGALAALPAEQGGAARGGEGAEPALLRRLAALGPPGWQAWRARFEALAQAEFAHVPPLEEALERFVGAAAGTRAAQRAALCLADLARERGDEPGALAALQRVRAQGPCEPDLEAALARRAPAGSPLAKAGAAPPQLELAYQLELGREDARNEWIRARRAGAALAELAGGALLCWSSGALLRVDAAGKPERIELAGLSPARGWSWVQPFRDAHSPWTPTLLARGTRALCVLGRARGRDGNVCAALELAPGAAPALAWAWDGSGARLGADDSPRALPAGLWEYQPGACESGGRVYLLARQYVAAAEAVPEVDELHAHTWCLCLELGSGDLLWQRELGTGADPATRDPARRPEPRGFCTPADPLALIDGRLCCSSGLSWLAVLDPARGRVLSSWRAGLDAEGLGERALLRPPAAGAEGIEWEPAASDWRYHARVGGAFTLEPRGGVTRLASSGAHSWWLRASGSAVRVESRLAGALGPRAGVALPLGERVQCACALGSQTLALATERALYLFDDRDAARLVERVALPDAARESADGSGALLASGERLYCAVGGALAAFRLR